MQKDCLSNTLKTFFKSLKSMTKGFGLDRLGWTLEKFDVPESVIAPLLKIHATGYHALDPVSPHHGVCDKRWMIQNNLVEEI